MANESLKHSFSSLNQSCFPHDTITEYLDKAYALAHVALSENFFNCKHSIMHAYLSTLEDLILQAKETFDGACRSI